MTSVLLPNPADQPQVNSPQAEPIVYPSEDNEPVAETYDHLYAMLTTLEVLKQHLSGQSATVLANQFLYYSQGFPSLRVAPDVMVIFNVEPGGRDNYKIWDEGEVPSVIFEMTSKGTQDKDKVFKKMLYAQLGVTEYWLFDPKGEWVETKLEGYRLHGEEYEPIEDQRSEPLGLRLEIDDTLIGFYREDTGEKLLVPSELSLALQQETQARVEAQTQAEQEKQRAEQEKQRAEQEKQRAEQEKRRAEQEKRRADSADQALASEQQKVAQLAEKLRELGIDPDSV